LAFNSAVVGNVRGFGVVLSTAVLSTTEGASSPLAARILRATSPNESWAATLTPNIAITAANNMPGYKSLRRMDQA
jgi:hypothetical protein